MKSVAAGGVCLRVGAHVRTVGKVLEVCAGKPERHNQASPKIWAAALPPA